MINAMPGQCRPDCRARGHVAQQHDLARLGLNGFLDLTRSGGDGNQRGGGVHAAAMKKVPRGVGVGQNIATPPYPPSFKVGTQYRQRPYHAHKHQLAQVIAILRSRRFRSMILRLLQAMMNDPAPKPAIFGQRRHAIRVLGV